MSGPTGFGLRFDLTARPYNGVDNVSFCTPSNMLAIRSHNPLSEHSQLRPTPYHDGTLLPQPTKAVSVYPVYVTHYSRGDDELPFHWEIVVKTGMNKFRPSGTVYHLAGSPATFHYEKLTNVHFEASPAWRGSLSVGWVDAARLPRLETLLSEVDIVIGPDWNCQNWVHAGLRKLNAQGFDIDREMARSWTWTKQRMEQLLQDWEAGDA
ncbi:hypothetical protein B0H21DRAFT_822248 [Amylocystis lapponica]|nr:hypothetical protein B0H21DRAFT_822248 [Amylocystis lapponica]